jgi:hypothetical protein
MAYDEAAAMRPHRRRPEDMAEARPRFCGDDGTEAVCAKEGGDEAGTKGRLV